MVFSSNAQSSHRRRRRPTFLPCRPFWPPQDHCRCHSLTELCQLRRGRADEERERGPAMRRGYRQKRDMLISAAD
ncbi:hypothetical protein HZ326_25874 [Fusarium oxysporum f. sp. albedinis]|nr:hypothetical protein HZ326_25874 [Fusarium oxysporum f. sp. albedinis]